MQERILIIDDDPNFVATIRDRLTFEGYCISVAKDGVQGLIKIDEERPHLIILDVMLRGFDKREFFEALKTGQENFKIPVIVCTTKDDAEPSLAGFGISGFFVKPFDPTDLLKGIKFTLKVSARALKHKAISMELPTVDEWRKSKPKAIKLPRIIPPRAIARVKPHKQNAKR